MNVSDITKAIEEKEAQLAKLQGEIEQLKAARSVLVEAEAKAKELLAAPAPAKKKSMRDALLALAEAEGI